MGITDKYSQKIFAVSKIAMVESLKVQPNSISVDLEGR